METTVFELILQGKIPARKVYENDDVLAFHDIQPAAPVHVLVIPKRKFLNLTECGTQDPAFLGRFLLGVSAAARELGLEEGGYRVVFNNGPDAQQSVAYAHAHILGGRHMAWPPG